MAEEIGCRLGRVENMIRQAIWSSGCRGIVIGVSGGVDSALAAAFCCRAIPPDQVLGLIMPSRITTEEDMRDAQAFCEQLRMEFRVISIDPVLKAFRNVLDTPEDPYLLGNMMARIRMTILYYYANRDNLLVCGTSNLTEYLLGYSTKWGDNAADIQPLLHLQKDEVFHLARETGVPERILLKKPSAGLFEGQTDEKDLGCTYEQIDAAIRSFDTVPEESRSDVERMIYERIRTNRHKRQPAFSLLP